MLRTLKTSYRISHMYFDPPTEILLESYKSASNGPYNLPLKFIYSKQKPTLLNKIFLDKQLKNRFQNVIEFIDQSTRSSTKQSLQKFPNIQESLQFKIQSFIKSRPQQITVHECNVGKAFFIEERKIYGVFFHRKLNLAKSCYSTEFIQKTRDLKYRFKGKLNRLEDMNNLQKVKNIYESERLSNIYKDTYEGFQKTQFITRSLIKVIADLKVEIKVSDFQESIRLGYKGPTQHIMQFQSYKVPYQAEQFVVTDIDFFLSGNYHFLKEKN